MNELETKQTITINDFATIIGVSRDTIERKVKELYPGIIQKGVTTYLLEYQITRIKEELNKNYSLRNVAEVVTNLDKMETILKAQSYLQDMIMELKLDNETMKPKAIVYDSFLSAGTYQGMNEVAKLLGIGRNKMLQKLRSCNIFRKNNTPYQVQMLDSKFKVIDCTKNGKTYPVTVANPKGIEYIKKILGV
ncbi:MAG: phage antirepressor KilAC domain-containing protein [Erysipelotrichaceae bacterium]